MFNYEPLYAAMRGTNLAGWLDQLPGQIDAALQDDKHGRLPSWRSILNQLPAASPSSLNLQEGVIIGKSSDLPPEDHTLLNNLLRQLLPWRKGPFHLFGQHIDSEWRSDWKWDRLKGEIQSLNGRLVLDVGCGNGYYAWRMAGCGARLVVGLDPYLLYVVQYQALWHFIGSDVPAYVLPLGIEALPTELAAFDTVFSMGVLYHQRIPQHHLQTLHACLCPGGELVLETLVIEGDDGDQLIPRGRYARMRNVWAIPSVLTLFGWLHEANFGEVRLVDMTPTTIEEQRTTEWMPFHSLADFLDPNDSGRTVEGYPAPRRAIITAVRPS